MARFNDLPTEIQLRIFEMAIAADSLPRIVLIYQKNGVIYPKTPPPPLLQVCQLSRYAVLKIHKPWLPQFKYTKEHKQYERLAKRRLAVNLHGYLAFSTYASALAKFQGLRTLIFYDDDDKYQSLGFKGFSIESKLARYATKSTNTSEKMGIDRWITYKYPKGYKGTDGPQPKPSRQRRAKISACNGWTFKSQKRARGKEDIEGGQLHKKRKLSSDEKPSLPRINKVQKFDASSPRSPMSSLHEMPNDILTFPPSPKQGLPQAFSGYDTDLIVMPMRRATRSSLPAPRVDTTASSDQAETGNEGETEEDQDSHVSDSKTEIDEEDPGADKPNSVDSDQAEGKENEYVPEKIHSERETAHGLEFLVQWEDYPNEADWTWEPEETMVEDATDLVISWQLERDELKVVTEEPEKILSKKKYRGVDHYLVKWKGYDKVEDRTWEPCERFGLDAPSLVGDYEAKLEKTRKRR